MTSESSLKESLAIQKRVIGALLMREILGRYGRNNIGFLWVFVSPMIYTVGISIIWSFAGYGHKSGFSVVAFAVTGYSTILIWRNMAQHCVNAVQPNHTLMHHRNIRLLDIYLSRLLLDAAGATFSFATLAIFWTCLGWMAFPVDPLEVMFGWIMLAWFGMSLAMFVGALSERWDVVEHIWGPLAYFLLPLSGALTIMHDLPLPIQHILIWSPMVSGVELVREGYFGSKYDAVYNVGYMAAFNLVLLLMALSQERVVSRKITV